MNNILSILNLNPESTTAVKEFLVKKVLYTGEHPRLHAYTIVRTTFTYSLDLDGTLQPLFEQANVDLLFLHRLTPELQVGAVIPPDKVLEDAAILTEPFTA